jgi:hypothetical protein
MDSDQLSKKDSDARRDAILLRMLKTPPKPHSEMKLGKRNAKNAKSPKRKKTKPD